MPNFKDEQFRQDLANIVNSNNFIQSYIKQNSTKDKKLDTYSCLHTALDYVRSFPGIKGSDMLSGHIMNFLSMELYINSSKNLEPNDWLGSEENDIAIGFKSLFKANPSFQDQIYNFVVQAQQKGVSLGDDGIRMLKTMSHMMDDLTSRYYMQDDLDYLNSWNSEKEKLDAFSKETQKRVENFSKNCVEKNVIGTALDVHEKDLIGQRSKLANQLSDLTSENVRKQHTEEYEKCSKRLLDNNNKFKTLNEKVNTINEQIDTLKNFYDNLRIQQDQIRVNKQLLKDYNVQESSLNQQLKDIDLQIEKHQNSQTLHRSAKEFLDNISPENKQRLSEISNLGIENGTIGTALFEFDNFRKNFAGTMQPDERYNIAKSILIKGDPSLQGKFEELERKGNHLSVNYGPMLSDMRKKIDSNQARIDEFKNTQFYKDYNNAYQSASEWYSEGYSIDALQTDKEEIKSQLQELQNKREDALSITEGWKTKANELLDDFRPPMDNPTLRDFGTSFIAKLAILEDDRKSIMKEGFQLGKDIANDTKRLAELKEGLNPAKITATEQQLTKVKTQISNVSKLKHEKTLLDTMSTSLSENIYKTAAKSNKAINEQYTKLGDRLANIVGHFDDVQSFWSRGKSATCEKMYKSMEGLVTKLKNPGTREEMINAFKETKKLAQDYLDAKNAQNRSKAFASEQRFWRLSMAEETIDMLNNAERMFTQMQKVPGIDKIEQFTKAAGNLKPEDAIKHLNANIAETSTKIYKEQQAQKEANKQKNIEHDVKNINTLPSM